MFRKKKKNKSTKAFIINWKIKYILVGKPNTKIFGFKVIKIVKLSLIKLLIESLIRD